MTGSERTCVRVADAATIEVDGREYHGGMLVVLPAGRAAELAAAGFVVAEPAPPETMRRLDAMRGPR